MPKNIKRNKRVKKIILITGSTDGIGLETAKLLASRGQTVLLHGRDPDKLELAQKLLSKISAEVMVDGFLADLSLMKNVEAMAKAVAKKYRQLDVLINNAGVYQSPQAITQDKLDIRFAVNTFAPYVLTQKLMPVLGATARVINVASAAQSPVDLAALAGKKTLSDEFNAYAQSKLALIMWSGQLACAIKDKGPTIITVNPGSLLGTKMVQKGFGVAGKDVRIGADILSRLALEDEFANMSGQYFDNDAKRFSSPHKDALDVSKSEQLVRVMEEILAL